ncbi:hypothetical protein EsDP_00001711 [Epichloe bromicola]|uniref:Peptide N-acetyl-beta-D-glucosaminyl asparaginase amidase A N-terminal domain-containing protein n=1 Tax=Epichloe bromicola TaxID=79588 RepID=A0ABQ0CIN8_9HYPO
MRNVVRSAFLVALDLATAELLVGRPAAQELLLRTSRDDARGYLNEPLQCLEVTGPVLSSCGLVDGNEVLGDPGGGEEERESCVVTLMEHVFANSYGQPFVANYVPPVSTSCSLASSFNRVAVNLTVVSEGRQFDRLATMWLNDIEVWRTSTAEPKPHPGIAWTYWKDMTNYIALWKQPQQLIFDLGNAVDDKYTGSFNATLTATFFREKANQPGDTGPLATPADEILAVSAGRAKSNAGSAWTYPDEKASASVSLPRNIKRAVLSIAATGQSDEEFWWSNVPEESKDTFNGTTLLGKGSFREVRLFIDGKIAGLSWPFPVLFTGGISPPLHRPMAGTQAFDLREQEIDITPWLGILCDGTPHDFSMEVVGADDAVVNRYWLLSGKIFVWLVDEKPGHVTRGPAPSIFVNKPSFKSHDESVRDKYARYDQTIGRNLEIKAKINAGSSEVDASWTQTFTMSNRGTVLDSGNVQNVTASYEGRDSATNNGTRVFCASYSYPILASFRQTAPDGNYSLTLDANLTQSMDLKVTGKTVFPNGLEAFIPFLKSKVNGASITTTKSGNAFFWQKDGGKTSGGFGSSRQHYVLASSEDDLPDKASSTGTGTGGGRQLYWRDISVVNETTTHDARWAYGLDLAATSTQANKPGPAKDDDDDGRPDAFSARFVRGRPGSLHRHVSGLWSE